MEPHPKPARRSKRVCSLRQGKSQPLRLEDPENGTLQMTERRLPATNCVARPKCCRQIKLNSFGRIPSSIVPADVTTACVETGGSTNRYGFGTAVAFEEVAVRDASPPACAAAHADVNTSASSDERMPPTRYMKSPHVYMPPTVVCDGLPTISAPGSSRDASPRPRRPPSIRRPFGGPRRR